MLINASGGRPGRAGLRPPGQQGVHLGLGQDNLVGAELFMLEAFMQGRGQTSFASQPGL